MENLQARFRNKLIAKHIPYATSVAKKFARRRNQFGVEWDELYGAALLGLVDAAQRYEPSHGVAFDAYSKSRIHGAMVDMLRRGGWNNPHYLRFTHDPNSENEESAQRSKDLPPDCLSLMHARTASEFACALNVIEDLPWDLEVSVMDSGYEMVELRYSYPVNPESNVMRDDLRKYLLGLFERIGGDEGKMLTLHYFEGLSFEQMRFEFRGVSKATLCRLHQRSLNLLKEIVSDDQVVCQTLVEEFNRQTREKELSCPLG